MKITNVYAVAAGLVLATALGVEPASAQIEGLKSEVPFEFYAAGKMFPAGTYILSQVNPNTLRLQPANGGQAVFMLAGKENTAKNNGNWLVFNQYGTRSFFADAYWSGSSTSMNVSPSRAEKEVAKIADNLGPKRVAAK